MAEDITTAKTVVKTGFRLIVELIAFINSEFTPRPVAIAAPSNRPNPAT